MEIINFNKKLYSQQAINSAIAAFSELAHFNLSEASDSWRLEITDIDQQFAANIRGEFANYVLGLES